MPLFTKTVSLLGKLITSSDGTRILDNFQKLENIRYTPVLKGIGGMTKINTTPLAGTDIRNGIHFRKVTPQVESHTLVQSFNGGASAVYDNTTPVPNTGEFTQLRADAAGAGTGRLDSSPVEGISYCNGKETLLWGGDKMRVATFLIASTDRTRADFITRNTAEFVNHTQAIGDTLSSTFSTIPDSAEAQLFIGSTQKIKSIHFTIEGTPPNRYTGPIVQYYDGSTWLNVTNLADTTAVGGFTLVQSGSYTFDDTQGVAQAVILDSLQLHWYRITFGTYAVAVGDINISHIDVSANMQPSVDLWDGGTVPLAVFSRSLEGGNDVVKISEDNYDTNNNATWVELNQLREYNSIPVPVNAKTITGLAESRSLSVASLLDQEGLLIYVIDKNTGEIRSTVDISPFYTDLNTDGLPTHLSYYTRAGKVNGEVVPHSGTDYVITGTKKIIKITRQGKFIEEFLNTEYDSAAGTSVGFVQYKSLVSMPTSGRLSGIIIDEDTKQFYQIDDLSGSIGIRNQRLLGFTPSGIRNIKLPHEAPVFRVGNKNDTTEIAFDESWVLGDNINLPNYPIAAGDTTLLYDPTDGNTGAKAALGITEGTGETTNNTISFLQSSLYIGAFQRLSGVKINFIPCNVNESPDDGTSVSVRGNKNNASPFVSLTGVIDTLRSEDGTTPFNRSGIVSWFPIPEGEEKQVSRDGLSLYVYKINLNSTTGKVKIYHAAGIPAQKNIKAYSFPVNAHDRLWLGDQVEERRNTLLVSSRFTDATFNGEDSTELSIGDKLPVVSAASVEGGVVVCKHSETWSVTGDTPSAYVIKNLSREVGCSSPLTMKSVLLKNKNDSLTQVAVWQDSGGVYMSTGEGVSKVSGDIDDLFDPLSPTRMNSFNLSSAFFDVINKEYHLLYPGTGSSVINKEIVFDIDTQSWYTVDRGTGKKLRLGFKVVDSTGNYYNYGGDSSGLVYRLENGTNFDGNPIVHVLKTADMRLTGENTTQTLMRRVNLSLVAKNVTGNSINATHYGDTSSTGKTFSMGVADASHRVKVSRADTNFGAHTYHALELSMSTSNEVVGFEPHEMLIYFTPVRREK